MQRNAFYKDDIPIESYISAVLSSHLQCVTSADPIYLRASLKHATHSLVKFSEDLIM